MDQIAALNRIAFLVEQQGGPAYRAMAFRRAATALSGLSEDELRMLASTDGLRGIAGIGAITAAVVEEAVSGEVPGYLQRLEGLALTEGGPSESALLRSALRGDCHTHSLWSDGRATIRDMALAAREIGHEYIVLTDHSPRLKIAGGLSAGRLREQLAEVAVLNSELAPFRILTGIEVDILADGCLDQEDDLLAELDVVVASAHSFLNMERAAMTARMLATISNPHVDILGHCTGRMRTAHKDRPESHFDAEAVFAACARLDKAVEINCQPQRRDPPRRLIRLALEAGCKFAINSDAHSRGELSLQIIGCERAADRGVSPERVVNALGAGELRDWTNSHRGAPRDSMPAVLGRSA